MPQVPDPFDAFRQAREQEGFRRRASGENLAPAGQGTEAVGSRGGRPLPAAATAAVPLRGQVEALVARLYAALDAAGEEQRLHIATFLSRILGLGQSILEVRRQPLSGNDQEFEVDFDRLFDFMLNPDVEGLKRAP